MVSIHTIEFRQKDIGYRFDYIFTAVKDYNHILHRVC